MKPSESHSFQPDNSLATAVTPARRTDAEQLVVNVNHAAAIAWAANALKALQVNAPELSTHAQRMVEALISELDHEHLSFSHATVVLRDALAEKRGDG